MVEYLFNTICADFYAAARQNDPEIVGKPALIASPWIAASLLQKSVRRGERRWAKMAASSLLTIDPARLWRRLAVIAVEDVGLGDLDTVALTISVVARRKQLAELYGKEQVVASITDALCKASKCRATDDLYAVIEFSNEWNNARIELAGYSDSELADVLLSDAAIEMRAIAIRYLMGTTWPHSAAFTIRKGAPAAFFELLFDYGYPETLVTLARENHSQTRVALSAFLLVLHQIHARCPSSEHLAQMAA